MAPGDLERLESRHVDDSLRLLPLLDEVSAGPCIDVGSGAGFPGIPLAIARPDRRWTLLEPRARRAAFLEEAIRELELAAGVVVARAEDAAEDPALAESFALATARALAPPTHAFALVRPFVAPGGAAAVFVGNADGIPSEAAVWREGVAIIRRDGS